MDARQVLEEARLAGLKISVEDGNLAVTPSSLLTESLREAIREHKPALVKALAMPAVPDPDWGWERMRIAGARLGTIVSDGRKQYQLWGVTPRGAICFDGQVLRTFDLAEVGL
jgi:hypothetical protein